MKKSLIPLICASIALVFLLGAGGTENSDTKGGNSSQTFSPSKGDDADNSPSTDRPTFKNGVLTTPDLKIQITRYKVSGHQGRASTCARSAQRSRGVASSQMPVGGAKRVLGAWCRAMG